MHIYADESGHSGKNIFAPPAFYRQGAILSVDDIEPIVSSVLNGYRAELGVPEIHANEIQPASKVAEIANKLMDALDEGTIWQFSITIIEKPYLATTKFVDSVFDSGENLGARWLWYRSSDSAPALCS
ncbi:MAG TPA: hypothetical protein VMT61_08930 [Candidatus Binataceae bacterium]|nr:hypothetical protein [Candidatus Binataceae bacterium]